MSIKDKIFWLVITIMICVFCYFIGTQAKEWKRLAAIGENCIKYHGVLNE